MQRAIASFGSLKTLIFACKANSSTLKNTTQNAPKPTILRAKIKRKFWGGGTAIMLLHAAQPPPQTPPPVGRGTPPPHTSPPSAPTAPRFSRLRRSISAPTAHRFSRLRRSNSAPTAPRFLAPLIFFYLAPPMHILLKVFLERARGLDTLNVCKFVLFINNTTKNLWTDITETLIAVGLDLRQN